MKVQFLLGTQNKKSIGGFVNEKENFMIFNDIDSTKDLRINGWNHSSDFLNEKVKKNEMVHFLAETSNICNFDCEYCYTVDYHVRNTKFHFKKLSNELSLKERLNLIDQALELGAVTYDIVGAGESLLDPYLFSQLEYAAKKGLTPVVFTNGFILNQNHIDRLWDIGASVVVKWHSKDHKIYDDIVRKKGAGEKIDKTIERLTQKGFNKTKPTRLGLNNVIYNKTATELPYFLEMCRKENLFPVCSTFIPAGRTKKGNEDELKQEEIIKVFRKAQKIDKEKFGILHSSKMPYFGLGKTCTQYFGLYVNIQGEIYGCPGQLESYGNIRKRSLKNVWSDRIKILKDYDGGCPPRKAFYSAKRNSKKFIAGMF